MHIVIDARVIASGTGTVVERLLHHLQHIDRTNRYTVLINRLDDDIWAPVARNFTKQLIDVPHHSFAEQTRLRWTIRRLAPDLVHYCMPQQPLFTGHRVITTIHDLTILRIGNPDRNPLVSLAKRGVGWFAFACAARWSSRIITDSAYSKGDIVKHLRAEPSKVRVIHAAADVRPIAPAPASPDAAPYIMYVGRQPAYKNIRRLCDAHQDLLATFPRLKLILVGRVDADVGRTQTYCRERGYRNIVFTGFLPDDRRDELYARAAAYVFPSLAEGFGLPGLEAMGYGTPVVSSNATCLPEIYGDAALYFDPRDRRDMVAAIRRVLEDEELRAALVRRGHDRLKRFSWRKMAEETHALYREVLGIGPANAEEPTD